MLFILLISILDSLVSREENEVETTPEPVDVSGERRTFTNEVTHPMTKVIVAALAHIRPAATLLTDPVLGIGKKLLVYLQAVRVLLLLGVVLRNSRLHDPPRCKVTWPDSKAKRLGCLIRPREPNPLLILLRSYIRPDFVAFDGISPSFGLLVSLIGRQNTLLKWRHRFDFFLTWRRRFEGRTVERGRYLEWRFAPQAVVG
jgi:hypothetical protein